MSLFNILRILRRASYVRRCHTEIILGEQNLGHHSFNVAMLVRLITGNGASRELIFAALDHDMPELITGDSPAPAKRASVMLAAGLQELEEEFYGRHHVFNYAELSYDEQVVLKIADILELVLFCMDQRKAGNTHVEDMERNARSYLDNVKELSNPVWSANLNEILKEIYSGIK